MGLFDSIGKALKCNAQKETVYGLMYECNDIIKELKDYNALHPNNQIEEDYIPLIKQHSNIEFTYFTNEIKNEGVKFNIKNYDSMQKAIDWLNNKISSISNDIENAKALENNKSINFTEDKLQENYEIEM